MNSNDDPAEGSDQPPLPTEESPRLAKTDTLKQGGGSGFDAPFKTQGKAEGER